MVIVVVILIDLLSPLLGPGKSLQSSCKQAAHLAQISADLNSAEIWWNVSVELHLLLHLGIGSMKIVNDIVGREKGGQETSKGKFAPKKVLAKLVKAESVSVSSAVIPALIFENPTAVAQY